MLKIKEKLNKNIKLILFIVVIAAAFCNNYFLVTEMKDKHGEEMVRKDVTMPPTLSLVTVALGPIRGLIVDALWWKVSELQESSEYFEIIRITDWITVMQPNNGFVWTYHSWNLAYNIAYEFPTAETRWKWVYSGIKLLRDEGLKMNPGNEFIESELAWLFLDRVGGFSDPSRLYFTEEWAGIVGKYLPDGDREDIEGLINPSTEADSKRAFELKEKLNLDPEKMLEIDRLYGPFQWKLPQAQVVYWGVRDDFSDYSQGDVNYRMNMLSALQLAFVTGGLVEDQKNGLFVVTNNLDLTDNTIKFFEEQIALSEKPLTEKNIFKEYIIHAAPILYGFGKKEPAMKLFEAYKRITPSQKNLAFINFIGNNMLRISEKSPGRYQQSLVEISLFKSYVFLAQGRFDEAARFADDAEKRWKSHQVKFAANKALQMPSFEDVKCAAFVKVLQKYPADRRKNLVNLAHNKLAAKLRIDSKYKFRKYVEK